MFTLAVNWGDGLTETVTGVTPGPFTRTHRYLDDNPTSTPADHYTITTTLTGGSSQPQAVVVAFGDFEPPAGTNFISESGPFTWPFNSTLPSSILLWDSFPSLTGAAGVDQGWNTEWGLYFQNHWVLDAGYDPSRPPSARRNRYQTFDVNNTSATGGVLGTMAGPTFVSYQTSALYDAPVFQVLSATYQPNTTYRLTVAVGLPHAEGVTIDPAFGGYNLMLRGATDAQVPALTRDLNNSTSVSNRRNLRVNSTDIARFNHTMAGAPGPIRGTFVDVTLEFTTGNADPILGQKIVVAFEKFPTSGRTVDFDNVRLSRQPAGSAPMTASTTVLVSNVPPTVTNLTTTAVVEGGTTTLTGILVDAGTQDTATVVVQWGDGQTQTFTNVTPGTFTYTHQYLDNPTGPDGATYPVAVAVVDDDGGSGTSSTSVRVSNVAPVLTNLVATTDKLGAATVTGVIVDPGLRDAFTLLVNWGDGVTETYNFQAGTSTFEVSHEYGGGMPTTFMVSLSVSDDDGATATASLAVSAGIRLNDQEGYGSYPYDRRRTDAIDDFFSKAMLLDGTSRSGSDPIAEQPIGQDYVLYVTDVDRV